MDELESAAWLSLVGLTELLPPSLDAQLQTDAQLTHFEFQVLSTLRFAPEQTVQSKDLAASTNSTLPRLSHVVTRLEQRGLVRKLPCPTDRRATNVQLSDDGRRIVIRATGGHIDHVRRLVIDRLDRDELAALAKIGTTLNRALDPSDRFARHIRDAD
ncbi:MarR family transcriptional regulator [Naasia lichenicola]|uniref:MarR family transcriptional regulator n=2 Tax=Naasia lichenicola TaxID=2565933 RepID=A0A4S4FJT9_9MICO|nr:MarR family transcriptional regulator [Naasia lichenicola]